MKILILVGSGDADSHSLHLAKAIQTGLEERQATAEIINLVTHKLPLYDRAIERADAYDDKTAAFIQKSYAADAFVWITPIHHNSFSGILKNALDWQHTKFPGKVVGMASNGGNRSTQAVDQLMWVARAQHLISTRIRVCTDSADFGDDKQLISEDIIERVAEFCSELVNLTRRIHD